MKYYPISLNISGRNCLIIGGGDVAERKAKRLLDCGAKVTVISEKLAPGLDQLKKEDKINHIASSYARSLTDGAFLIFGTTDDPEVNAAVFHDAREKGILVNVADDPGHCDFILPSFFEQGDLQIAVSTGGKSPALARKLRTEVESVYGPEYGVYLAILGELRKAVVARNRPSSVNKKLFEAVVNSDILGKIRRGERDAVKRLILDLTGIDLDVERFF